MSFSYIKLYYIVFILNTDSNFPDFLKCLFTVDLFQLTSMCQISVVFKTFENLYYSSFPLPASPQLPF